MRKFDDQEVSASGPADTGVAGSDPVIRLVVPRPTPARSAGLKALVDFAIDRGYYAHWNSTAGPGVTHCKSKDFPTDKDGDSN